MTSVSLPARGASRSLQVATLLYHEVTDEPASSGFQRPGAAPYRHSTRAFAEHLEAIAGAPATPERVVDVDYRQPGRHLLLTFDDGGRSALYVADALSERGWRGHFFIVTSLIGTAGFLSADDIRYLHSCGHLIGSHSHTHPDIFRDQPLARMIEEWTTSCGVLAGLLGDACIMASIPGGDGSARAVRSAAMAGMTYLFTSVPRLSPGHHGSCRVLGRFCAKATTSPTYVRTLARFNGWHQALAVRRAKDAVRLSCPPLYRWYVWQRTSRRTSAN
ncbi:MAG TPA: polysaccharide deacetylase family protein [Gemmatimonadaceae bacterium]|nr:polysaccharide deacetylase family protein [Gemmatimonadaceae bacterium]